MISKPYRHETIRKIIRRQKVFSQEDLRQELKKEKPAIEVSQETLSRDLREMRLVRTVNGYMETPSRDTEPLFSRMAAEFLRSVRTAQNLVILRTGPGHANTVAVALDDENWEEVIGTVAGDDTIMVIAEDNARALDLQRRFLGFLNPSESDD